MEIITLREYLSGPARQYDPLNDYLFYKVMGEKGSELQLLGFLNAVLGKTGNDRFTSVMILENKTFMPETIGDKSCILDVRALLQSKTMVNVEVQLRNQHNMDRRSLFYWSREYSKSLSAGMNYRELPDVISINIVNFDYPPIRKFHTCYHLREDQHHDHILTNALEIHYLNMVQYRKQGRVKLHEPLNRWLAWLDKGSPPGLIAEVTKMDEAIQTANERMAYITQDEEVARAYWRRQMALADHIGEVEFARDEGKEIGLEKGREIGCADARTSIARNLLEEGSSPEFIQKVTGLDAKTIQGLSADTAPGQCP